MSESPEDHGDDADESDSDVKYGLSGIQEKRDEDIVRVSLEWCEIVRDVGESYREIEDIDEVAAELGLNEEDVREAAIVYRFIFEDPPRDVSMGAHTTAIDYFNGRNDIESLSRSDSEEGLQKSREYLKEFVGAVYRIHDIDEVEEIGDIPEEMDVDLPSIDFDFDELFPAVSALNNLGPLLSGQMITQALPDNTTLNAAIDAMSYQQDLRNIGLMANSLPSLAEQLRIPNEVFEEMFRSLNSFGAIQSSIENIPSFEDVDRVGPADRIPNTDESIQEPELDIPEPEEPSEDYEPDEAVEYAVISVGEAMQRPPVRDWFLNANNRRQNTIVGALLFGSILTATGGNIVIAAAISPLLAPGLADVLETRLRTEEDAP